MDWNPRVCSDRTANVVAWLMMLAIITAAALALRFIADAMVSAP